MSYNPIDGIEAVGIIEAHGFVPIFEAVDAMVKASEVEVTGVVKIGGHIVSCLLTGELAAVRVAVDVGEEAARAVSSEKVSSVVFASPSDPVCALAAHADELIEKKEGTRGKAR
jgi:ethanolamine utilization protein EutM